MRLQCRWLLGYQLLGMNKLFLKDHTSHNSLVKLQRKPEVKALNKSRTSQYIIFKQNWYYSIIFAQPVNGVMLALGYLDLIPGLQLRISTWLLVILLSRNWGFSCMSDVNWNQWIDLHLYFKTRRDNSSFRYKVALQI